MLDAIRKQAPGFNPRPCEGATPSGGSFERRMKFQSTPL